MVNEDKKKLIIENFRPLDPPDISIHNFIPKPPIGNVDPMAKPSFPISGPMGGKPESGSSDKSG